MIFVTWGLMMLLVVSELEPPRSAAWISKVQ
jgi:hypothetical protein